MRKAIVALALAATCTLAEAVDWRSLGTANNEELYIDMGSIRHIGEYPQVWTKINYVAAKSVVGKSYRSVVTLMYFDCDSQESGPRSTVFYERLNGEGDKVHSASWPVKNIIFTPPEPGTSGEKAMWAVCARFAPFQK